MIFMVLVCLYFLFQLSCLLSPYYKLFVFIFVYFLFYFGQSLSVVYFLSLLLLRRYPDLV